MARERPATEHGSSLPSRNLCINKSYQYPKTGQWGPLKRGLRSAPGRTDAIGLLVRLQVTRSRPLSTKVLLNGYHSQCLLCDGLLQDERLLHEPCGGASNFHGPALSRPKFHLQKPDANLTLVWLCTAGGPNNYQPGYPP